MKRSLFLQDFSEEAYKSREVADVDVLGLLAASMPVHGKRNMPKKSPNMIQFSSVVAGLCKLTEPPASTCSASRNLTAEGATATGCRVARQAEE